MITPRFLAGAILFALCGCGCFAAPSTALSSEQKAWLARAHRAERAGWIYLHTEGEPRQRGFQHGYLLAKEIADGVHTTRISWEYQSSMEWPWLVARGAEMFVPKMDQENLSELEGIAEGARAA